jgi:5-methylcytosine-specific restriction endonuclease McrA
MQVLTQPPSGWPALVLNADFRPLSYYPLSLWSWQDVIKAVWQERVEVIQTYDKVVRSPSLEYRLPSVIALKDFIAQDRAPAFTRFNLFLRDEFTCQYCGTGGRDMTFDHVVPRSQAGVPPGTTSSPPVRRAISGRAGAPRVSRGCCCCRGRSSRRPGNSRPTGGAFRPTICTKAGSTISTGTSSWSPDQPLGLSSSVSARVGLP